MVERKSFKRWKILNKVFVAYDDFSDKYLASDGEWHFKSDMPKKVKYKAWLNPKAAWRYINNGDYSDYLSGDIMLAVLK